MPTSYSILTVGVNILGHVLGRYLLREIFGFYLVGIFLFIALRTTDLLSARSGIFLQQRTPLSDIGLLALYRLPDSLGVSLAFGLVFAILVALARWIRQSELKAALAAGMPPYRLLSPVLFLGLLFGGVSLYVWGWLRPLGQQQFNQLEYRIFYNEAPSSVLADALFTPEKQGIFYAQRVYPITNGGQLLGVRIIRPDGTTYSSNYGLWKEKEKVWRLEQAQRVRTDGRVENLQFIELPFSGSFVPRRTNLDELILPELAQLAATNPEAQFLYNQRLSNSVAVLILAWLAGAIGLGLRDAGWAFVAVVVLLFLYYVLWSLSNQFARLDVFGSWGAWVPSMVYALLALGFTVRLRRS